MGSRKLLGELRRVLPVRRDVAGVEQPGVAEREGAGADRAITLALRGDSRQPFQQTRVGRGIVRQRRAAGNQRKVKWSAWLVERGIGDERHAVGGTQWTRLRA